MAYPYIGCSLFAIAVYWERVVPIILAVPDLPF